MLKQPISNGQLVLIDSELDQLQEYLRKIFSFIVGWFGGLTTHTYVCAQQTGAGQLSADIPCQWNPVIGVCYVIPASGE